MPRYCVTVTRPEAYFVDAPNEAIACTLAIGMQARNARPDYTLRADATADRCHESEPAPTQEISQ